MKRVLVTGASGIVGYGILRALRASGKPLFLIGSSIHTDSVAPAFCDLFEQAPRTDDPGYMQWLLAVIQKHRIDLLIPGIEADVHYWNTVRSQLTASGAYPLLNEPQLIELCQDKWAFYQQLLRYHPDCAIPGSLSTDFHELREAYGLPFLLKPRHGFGSKGIIKVEHEQQFVTAKQKMADQLMAQPIIGTDDEEYTVAGFGNGNGQLLATMAMKRKLSKDGFTDKAEVVPAQQFETVLSALSRQFKPLGPTNFQFRKTGNGFKLLEINPRVSSSTSIRVAFGYNESAMAVEYFLEQQPLTQPAISTGTAIRYVTEHIFYDHSFHL